MGRQGQRHTRNQTKPSGNDIYGLISLNYIGKRNRTNTDSLSEYTVNTQYRTMTYTGPDQWLNNHDRLGLTTGWVKSLRYTKNTRSCIMTSTYICTSSHTKHLPSTPPQTDALTRRRHPRLPLNIHEMSWQRVSRHVRE